MTKRRSFGIFVEAEKMGRIFEALRPYMSDFCDMVDPADLMRQLPQMRSCDSVGLHVMFVLCGIYLLQYIIASLCCSYFHWATFVKRFALCCQTIVCPVCLSCLSCPVSKVGVLCQTVGQIKMKLGMQVGLGTGHTVLDRDPGHFPKGAQPPIFGAYLLWPNGSIGQDATW